MFHRAAMQARLQKDETWQSAGAPPVEEFIDAWRASGGRGRSSEAPADVAKSRRKRNSLEWCLCQAKRDEERRFVASADSVCVAMDERHCRTLVTYAACKGTQVSSGVLAQFRKAGRSAEEIAALVRRAVRRFCILRVPHKKHQHAASQASTAEPGYGAYHWQGRDVYRGRSVQRAVGGPLDPPSRRA